MDPNTVLNRLSPTKRRLAPVTTWLPRGYIDIRTPLLPIGVAELAEELSTLHEHYRPR
ncbi:hypothetical protein [Pseudonocardia spinosispora]|uniref:hypothetical protein n=1 Tax=Pseudonocardia spinosispora TaxID=103441 RepID=UPI000428E416|nr:hypothetical protein [Pseudonocardia spinosispora]